MLRNIDKRKEIEVYKSISGIYQLLLIRIVISILYIAKKAYAQNGLSELGSYLSQLLC